MTRRKESLLAAATSTLLVAAMLLVSVNCNAKEIVGETARMTVEETGLSFLARIDTGARRTSIHAADIFISDRAEEAKDDIGKTISFITRNNKGERKIMEATIVDVTNVRNAQGQEDRYEVELTIAWQQSRKKVRVNLRDRSKMTYKLLIGRNWLADDFLVDVDIKEE
jgi:hypothetical protein